MSHSEVKTERELHPGWAGCKGHSHSGHTCSPEPSGFSLRGPAEEKRRVSAGGLVHSVVRAGLQSQRPSDIYESESRQTAAHTQWSTNSKGEAATRAAEMSWTSMPRPGNADTTQRMRCDSIRQTSGRAAEPHPGRGACPHCARAQGHKGTTWGTAMTYSITQASVQIVSMGTSSGCI